MIRRSRVSESEEVRSLRSPELGALFELREEP